MFWFLPFFVLLLELQTTSSSLVCMKGTQVLNFTSSDVINTTTYAFNSNSPSICTAKLTIDYALAQATVEFDGDSHNFDNILIGKNVIKHNMEIGLHDDKVYRQLQISCFNNDSCSEDMKKIYDKSKQLNHTILQNDLKAQLYNNSFPRDQLTCLNNHEQEFPCPNGYCELNSNSKSEFNYKCVENSDGNNEKVIIEQHVLGETNAESSFTYRCNIRMCNDKKNAEKVHHLLKTNWLLTPTGVGPDPPNTAMIILSKTSNIIQCILWITIITYFKYN